MVHTLRDDLVPSWDTGECVQSDWSNKEGVDLSVLVNVLEPLTILNRTAVLLLASHK